jgi:hypothetical protein
MTSINVATQLLEYLMVNTIFQIDLLYAIGWSFFGINQVKSADASYCCFFLLICAEIIIIASLINEKLKSVRA